MTVPLSRNEWQNMIKPWEGLDDFRELLRKVHNKDPNFIKDYKLQLVDIPKDQILQALDEQIASPDVHDLMKQQLQTQKELLLEVKDDVTLRKSTRTFDYEIVFKDHQPANNIKGFAKISKIKDKSHNGLLSWEDASNPILFYAEVENGNMRFHINYGDKGIAIIEELLDAYRWTHCAKSKYLEMLEEEFGSVRYSKQSQQFELEQGNLAAAQALSRAKKEASNGKMLIENNIDLMQMYKGELIKIIG